MTGKTHQFEVDVHWTGNRGEGTASYRSYGRDHDVVVPGAPTILGSAAPAYRGDADRWNPEQLQVAALSQCHMLWFLHLATTKGVVVVDYRDHAEGVLALDSTGGGQFASVTLRPHVTVADGSDADVAQRLHADVPALCFIARSVNFPVHHEPTVATAGDDSV